MTPEDLAQFHKLELAARQCRRCNLCATRRNVVFGDGNPSARLTLVGEGPGENEDATGTPFVGRAGALLDRALKDNGLSRADVYICNIVKCRPTLVEAGRVRNRPPMLPEVEACAPWLDSQLRLIAPKVIVCLGSPSANALIHKGFRITQERGVFYPCRYATNGALAAFHPAYILRQMGDEHMETYKTLVDDLAKAWARAKETEKPVPTVAQPSLF